MTTGYREDVIDALETLAQYGIPNSGSAHLFDVGTGPYLDYFEREVIDGFVSHGGATCKFFEGAYGSGKTHLLQLLRQRALEKGMIVASADLSQALRLEDWKQITAYILENMEARVNHQMVRSLPKIISALHAGGNIHADNLKKVHLVHPGFHNALWWAAQKEHLNAAAWSTLSDFLTGNRVSVADMRRHILLGVKGPLNGRNAELVLKTVLGGLYHLGVPGVLLLFDENERTLQTTRSIPPRSQRIAANLMRRLIDGCTTGLLVGTVSVFAVLPGFLEMCSRNYPALGQRLQMVSGGLPKQAWRVPTLPLEKVNIMQHPEDFLKASTEMFISHVERLQGDTAGLREQMTGIGQRVLENNVGSGYKRELMKSLSHACLSRL
ncbi:DUF2791 family P-loop domain-containing protein [Brevibacillus centrosporus]|uniref:BREX system ATP-binding domain-containing protein n=1 Tax=Brevibacillus centrosporus TaxID=54910 RepID=UPI002E1CF77A|nr:DUF2791 family P-loop domain-containing protein [Brevibacillus centrosporus]